MMNYPLTLSFKIISFGPKISVTDATGQQVMFIHMKALKLKEDVRVYANEDKAQELFQMAADRVIDFNATYNFKDSSGRPLGSSKREGMRSLWKVSYNLMDISGNITHNISEENPWIKMADAVAESIPVVGMFAGYFFNPTYILGTPNGDDADPTPVLTVTKQPAFFEGKFTIDKVGEIANEEEEARLLLGVIMMTLLERSRG